MLPETGSGFEVGLIKPRNVSREYYAASRCIAAATIDCVVTRIRQRNKEQSFARKKARGKHRNVKKTENGRNEPDKIRRLAPMGASKESPSEDWRRLEYLRKREPYETWPLRACDKACWDLDSNAGNLDRAARSSTY